MRFESVDKQSILVFYNFLFAYITAKRSCWLELAELCIAEKQALPTWQEISLGTGANSCAQELECAKIMYACFLVHAYLEKHCGDLAMQVVSNVYKLRYVQFPDDSKLLY